MSAFRVDEPGMTKSSTALAVEFESIARIFPHCRAVDGVSARFDRGQIHAILGENGAGKSTLMKLLFGLLEPTDGSLKINGTSRKWNSPAEAIRAGLGMVQQHFALVETLSVIDNIMLGAEKTSFGILDRAGAIKDLESHLPSPALRLNWHQPVQELSIGEKQKVEILKLIARRAEILVLDEPTAVLSPQEIESLFEILKSLKQQGKTVFVITHKLNEVFDHCDTWFVLRAGQAKGQGLVRETQVDDVVRAMVGSKLPPMADRTPAVLGERAVEFKNVSVTEAAHPVRGLSFQVRKGEVVGIAGVDGSGQSELVEALLGLRDFEGEVTVLDLAVPQSQGAKASAQTVAALRSRGLALVSEDRHHQSLWLEETVELNAGLGFEKENGFVQGGMLRPGTWRAKVSEWLTKFDVRFNSLEIAVGRLSGGNQQKLIFARELLGRPANLIVVHQPTRGVDFAAIRLIHERILEARDRGVAVLVISSELDELMTLSDRILVLCSGRQTGEFARNFSGAPYDRERIGVAMTDAGAQGGH